MKKNFICFSTRKFKKFYRLFRPTIALLRALLMRAFIFCTFLFVALCDAIATTCTLNWHVWRHVIGVRFSRNVIEMRWQNRCQNFRARIGRCNRWKLFNWHCDILCIRTFMAARRRRSTRWATNVKFTRTTRRRQLQFVASIADDTRSNRHRWIQRLPSAQHIDRIRIVLVAVDQWIARCSAALFAMDVFARTICDVMTLATDQIYWIAVWIDVNVERIRNRTRVTRRNAVRWCLWCCFAIFLLLSLQIFELLLLS